MEAIRQLIEEIDLMRMVVPHFGFKDLLDILIVAYLLYKLLVWIKETRALALFKGIAVILVFALVAWLLNLNTILWIITNAVQVAIIAVIIVFQPELRRALEQIGTGKLSFKFLFPLEGSEDGMLSAKVLDEILTAARKMAAKKTGALILIEQDVPLGDHERTGIPINAEVSSQLLISIFEKNTPLHDGATIIRQNRIAAATCLLPLTETELSMDLGTRHRAAVGASEVSDAFIIVVSEETGAISLAYLGDLHQNITTAKARDIITRKMQKTPYKKFGLWKSVGGAKKNVEEDN